MTDRAHMRDDVLHAPTCCRARFVPFGVSEVATQARHFRPLPPRGIDPVHGLIIVPMTRPAKHFANDGIAHS